MKTYDIVLTEDQLKVIIVALDELPHRIARPLIDQLNAQVSKQMEKVFE